jgi:hypothetical protein
VVTTEFALRMLGPDRQRATGAYESLIRSASTGSPLDHRNERDPRILGGDAFAQRVVGEHWTPRQNAALQQVVDDACAKFEVSETELRSRSHLKNISQARDWIMQQARSAEIVSVASLAQYFNRDASSIRQVAHRRRSKA